MKHYLTILLLLCSIAVIGQSKFDKKVNTPPISQSLTLKSDSVYRIGSGLKYEGGELVPTPGNSKTVFYSDSTTSIKFASGFSNLSHFLYTDNKPVLKMSPMQPDGSYEIWINKKAITWTSDSTFVLKIKR